MPEVFGIARRTGPGRQAAALRRERGKSRGGAEGHRIPNVQSVQIIFNIFRQRPAELFFTEAQKRKVGILARVPLASGLLSGKITRESKFAKDDHRNFNRHGEAFDRGETFRGRGF
jgi:aryl-alcohol dehydrogenase-like predicted oxidoreductase